MVSGGVCESFNWTMHAYCSMSNHYHLLLETVDANLSQGIRQLNGLYTQRMNRRHDLLGQLVHGRYKAIFVQKKGYLLELTCYRQKHKVRSCIESSAPLYGVTCSFDALIQDLTPEFCTALQFI